jgi:hypothetical protein
MKSLNLRLYATDTSFAHPGVWHSYPAALLPYLAYDSNWPGGLMGGTLRTKATIVSLKDGSNNAVGFQVCVLQLQVEIEFEVIWTHASNGSSGSKKKTVVYTYDCTNNTLHCSGSTASAQGDIRDSGGNVIGYVRLYPTSSDPSVQIYVGFNSPPTDDHTGAVGPTVSVECCEYGS